MGLGIRHRIEKLAESAPIVRSGLIAMHMGRGRLNPWAKVHPIDRRYRVRTHGIVPIYLLRAGTDADAHVNIYAGCVPSALRAALATLSDLHEAEFFDLGCGAGRALVVASEYPFRKLTGIDLSADMVRLAQDNLNRMRPKAKMPISVVRGDASAPVLGDGDCVVFLYNSFGRPLVEGLCRTLVQQLSPGRRLFLIYENPVHGDVFDAAPEYVRWYGAMSDYDPEEVGFGFDEQESMALWALNAGAAAGHCVDWSIRVTKADARAVIDAG